MYSPTRWLPSLILIIVLGICAFAGTSTKQAVPATSQNVLVTNTSSQPVPVVPPSRPTSSGSYVVSVANVPTVSVQNTSPLVTTSRETRTPVSYTFDLFKADGNYDSYNDAAPIPAHKRFFAKFFTAWVPVSRGVKVPILAVNGPTTPANGSSAYAPLSCLPMTWQSGPDLDLFSGSTPVDFVIDSGKTMQIWFETSSSVGNVFGQATVSGYLETVP